MRTPTTVRAAETFGRTRLSQSFFMRDFLYSEIANVERFTNLPANPDIAIAAGRELCENLLEPLQATFGRLALRSGYRSPEVNGFGNVHNLSCASSISNRGRHTWDERDSDGMLGATVTVVVPWLVDRAAAGGTPWTALAWWIHDHLPYSELEFFPKLLAFNIAWREVPRRTVSSYVAPRGLLTKPGMPNHDGDHGALYRGFPKLVQTARFSPARHEIQTEKPHA